MHAALAHSYDFETVGKAAKSIGVSIDVFAFNLDAMGLLLWFGDLKSARAGVAKVVDANAKMVRRVRSGEDLAEQLSKAAQKTDAALLLQVQRIFGARLR